MSNKKRLAVNLRCARRRMNLPPGLLKKQPECHCQKRQKSKENLTKWIMRTRRNCNSVEKRTRRVARSDKVAPVRISHYDILSDDETCSGGTRFDHGTASSSDAASCKTR